MAKKTQKNSEISKITTKKTTSPYIKVKSSSIHNKGVFANKNIKKGTKIIEYVGEKISKKESEIRADKILNAHKKDGITKGAVYIFELNKKQDIDGNVSYNTARWINHSCNPNCEAVHDNGGIWIYAKKNIKEGRELTYNYGYDLDSYKEHPCKCGSKKCIGYIAAQEHWWKLRFLKVRDVILSLFR